MLCAEEKENKQGSKPSAKKRGRPSKASKEASQDAPGGTDLNGDDDADHAEDQGTDKALSKRQRRGKPEPKYGSVKASDAPAGQPILSLYNQHLDSCCSLTLGCQLQLLCPALHMCSIG